MASNAQILFSLLFFNLVIFTLLTFTYTPLGVKNPICDIFDALATQQPGCTPSGSGSGVSANFADPSSLTSGQQQLSACGIGGIIGGTIGLFGFLGGPLGLITTPSLAIAGCSLAAGFFPQQGANLVAGAINSLGPLGAFIQLVLLAMQWAVPFVSFFVDFMKYDIAVMTADAVFAVVLGPLQAITITWIFKEFAYYIRGLGATG